eukprot:57200_1
MSIVLALFIVVQHINAQFTTQGIILCNETVSGLISGGQSHYYQLNTNQFYEINVVTCESDIDVRIHILDDSNNDISSDYCSDGDVCGSCKNENNDHENFTIPLQSASYYIQIQPYSITTIVGRYEFTINCIPVQLTTISCGETTKDFIDGGEVKYYQITIRDSVYMNFEDCPSDTDLEVTIFDDDHNDISSEHCSSGDWCGSCVNEENYPENFTLPNLSPQPYFIHIKTYSRAVKNGTVVFTVECINATAVTSGSNTSLYSNYGCDQEIQCGEVVSGYLQLSNEWAFMDMTTYYQRYCFTLSNASSMVNFDSCGSFGSPTSYLSLMNTNYTTIVEGDDTYKYGYCERHQQQLTIKPYSLPKGTYILYAKSSDCCQHHVHVMCTENLVDDHKYKILVGHVEEWMSAQIACEKQYGTSLATIITENDRFQAIEISKQHSLAFVWIAAGLQEERHSSVDVFTGMYLSIYNESVQWNSNISPLCDAPKTGYKPRNCTGLQSCWARLAVYNETYLISDVDAFAPHVAYWDSQLFVIGQDQIHHTTMATLEDIGPWNHTSYHQHMFHQTCTQYQSSLYMLGLSDSSSQKVLNHFNLDTLNIQSHVLPSGVFIFRYCIVAAGDYVYIIERGSMLIYQVSNDTWNTVPFTDIHTTVTCVATNDNAFIYLFDIDEELSVVEYNIQSTDFEHIDTPNICNSQSPLYSPTFSAVTMPNDKIYLHGCYTRSWKTLVFDTKIKTFETKTIDVDKPTAKNIAYYRTAKGTKFEDNVLLLVHTTDGRYPRLYVGSEPPSISLYYTVTEPISINFTDTSITSSSNAIFPSDGFRIKYTLNDFSNFTNKSTNKGFNVRLMDQGINASIMLNTSSDGCLCHSYKCSDCSLHFELSNYLTLEDRDIFKLNISPSMYKYGDPNLLILPKYITIPLQRCIISFEDFDNIITSDNPMINFMFSLSSNCYSRVSSIFSLNITATSINIFSQLFIEILNNSTIRCAICEIRNQSCSAFDGNHFAIEHRVNGRNSKEFDLWIESNMIDLNVNRTSSKNSFKYIPPDTKVTTEVAMDNKLLYLLIIAVVICLLVVVYCLRKCYMNVFVVDNALVWIIGISIFDDENTNNLPGIERNVADLVNLWRDAHQYDVNVFHHKTLRGTKDDIIEFIDSHATELADDGNNYKCIIVHVLSHGSERHFLASDGQKVAIDLIHHEIETSLKYEKQKKVIKILFHHGCQTIDAKRAPGCPDQNIRSTASVSGLLNAHSSIKVDDITDDNMTYESNTIKVSGNVADGTVSDSGTFTDCICDSLTRNLDKWVKQDLMTIITEIGRNVEEKTNHEELVRVDGTLRYPIIRFEICQDVSEKAENMEYTRIEVNQNDDDDYAITCPVTETH